MHRALVTKHGSAATLLGCHCSVQGSLLRLGRVHFLGPKVLLCIMLFRVCAIVIFTCVFVGCVLVLRTGGK